MKQYQTEYQKLVDMTHGNPGVTLNQYIAQREKDKQTEKLDPTKFNKRLISS